MNKAVPWNVNGVGFDAREAAREAARRQGKSLGEWLHGVIADHAADLGVDEREIVGRQRVEAVTSKLERLSARSADHDRRMRAGRGSDGLRGRSDQERDEDIEDRGEPPRHERSSRVIELRRRRETSASDATELLLEDAIDAMERRALRVERNTDKALQSFTSLIERNEAQRDRDRDSVSALVQKLADIETRLTDRVSLTDDNPINSALARLEARLDMINRRSTAESVARQRAEAEPVAAAPQDSFERLEEKLNSIYRAVQTRPVVPVAGASPLAIAASQAEWQEPVRDRRLGHAIAAIAERQRTLQDPLAEAASLQQTMLRRRLGAPPVRDEPMQDVMSFAAMQKEIAGLATQIGDMRRDLVGQRKDRPEPAVDFESLRAELSTMSDTLRELAPRRDLGGVEASIRDLSDRVESLRDGELRAFQALGGPSRASGEELRRIDSQMQEIRDLLSTTAAKVDGAVERVPRQDAAENRFPGELKGLEGLVRDLARKMDAVQAPGADTGALDALQHQLQILSARFERTDEGFSKLTSIERSMRELFAQIDATRADAETTAARTAREVLRIAMEEGRLQSDQGTATSLAAVQALQTEAEARTASTLDAVHGTLEKVVGRLSVMETEIAEARQRPTTRPPEVRVQEPVGPDLRSPEPRPVRKPMTLGAPDPILDQALGRKPAEKPAKESPRPADLDEEGGRADFIAAARRAAKVAQSDPSLAEFKKSAGARATTPARAGLIEQTRDYVTRHKRPMLLGIAALFVIIGTMAIIQRITADDGDVRNADLVSSTRVASATLAPKTQPVQRNADLTPSALPVSPPPPLANPIPGSDPIQTGSITSLPAFAAAGPGRPAARPAGAMSANLRAMAAAGDSAAEYVLGTQYAEGKVVPRDLVLAAQWYQKAAAQNLAPAQYRLASLYEKGMGVGQDKAKARTLYLQAAEAGNPRAMHNLAVMLADGDGKPDYDGAATWFRKAAQYGIHDSQYNFAILLARGIGVQQSLVQSYQWFAIAATQGDADAAKKRDEVGAKLTANDLAVAKALAGSFRPRIADIAATEVQPPPGGWDGASAPSTLNSARQTVSSL